MTRLIRTVTFGFLAVIGLATTAAADPAGAARARADVQKTLGFVPEYMQKLPDSIVAGAWEEIKTLELSPDTALDGRTKELIGLAVSAQIPCRYCVIAHTEFAKVNGATEAELGEALAMAAQTRKWSTVLNGLQLDETRFRGEVARIIEHAKLAAQKKSPSPVLTVNVTDGASALSDITATLGFVPEFLQKFPAVARAGAWQQLKSVELAPTLLSAKTKELIGVAVAAQVPCRYCVIAHTEYARANGATGAELAEAIAMSSLTRGMSTLLNGMQLDETRFRGDVDRLARDARASKQAANMKRR